MIDLSRLKINEVGPKTNPESVVYGNKDGLIHFGYLYSANMDATSASAIAGVHLQGYHSLHYMSMMKNGPMQGATINRCPGPYQIICASEHAGVIGQTEGTGYFLFAENGDIVIRAPNGRVRISGQDVDIRADGSDTSRGSINLDSNQSINLKTGSLDMKATLGMKLFTPKSIDIVANTSLGLMSNFINGLTSGSSTRPAKTIPSSASTQKFKTSQNYN
jgi:hypothetical protein